jgi:hypothetical protein
MWLFTSSGCLDVGEDLDAVAEAPAWRERSSELSEYRVA